MGAWLCLEDEAGQSLRPPKGRTWGRRRHTLVVRLAAVGTKRVSIRSRRGPWRNLSKHSLDDLAALVKIRLKRVQCRPRLTDSLVARSPLDFHLSQPQPQP